MSLAQAANKGDTIAKAIIDKISDEIGKKAAEIRRRHIEQMTVELADAEKEVVAAAAIRIARHSSIGYTNDRIIIEIMDQRKGTE